MSSESVVVPAGMGLGWTRVAEAIAAEFPVGEITRLWVFPKLKQDEREWGTAVVSRRCEDERLAIYTARYVILTRGREKGQGRVEVQQVGFTSEDVIELALEGVQERVGETEPPAELEPELWFGVGDDDAAAEG